MQKCVDSVSQLLNRHGHAVYWYCSDVGKKKFSFIAFLVAVLGVCTSAIFVAPVETGAAGVRANDAYDYLQVSAGSNYTCVLNVAGKVSCWGGNREGQSTAPVGKFVAVFAGHDTTCALNRKHIATCWGWGTPSNPTYFPNGALANHLVPPSGKYKTLALGTDHACGLKLDRSVVCWGEKSTFYDRWAADSPVGKFKSISARWDLSCGVQMSGKALCWGNDRSKYSNELKYRAPEGSFSSVVTGGSYFSCGIRPNKNVECWGVKPDLAANPSGKFLSVSLGDSLACGITTSHKVKCWQGLESLSSTERQSILAGLKIPAIEISAGRRHLCIRHKSRPKSVDCFGENDNGRLNVPQLDITDY